MSRPLLQVRGLHAQYGPTRVLHGIDFDVAQGGITTLLGANGAGKTTTLRAVCGMVATQGEVLLGGEPIQGRATEHIVRKGVAHVPDGRGTFLNFSVEENLRIGAYTRRDRDAVLADYERMFSWFPRLRETYDCVAMTPGPEDVFLALRGLRTMELRLREAQRQALGLAHWLEARAEVKQVLHPALPSHPGHAIWRRDFSGSSGLFSVILQPASTAAVHAMLDGLELFGLGYSWGGYESLVIPFDCATYRTATTWAPGGPALRFQVGFEDLEDLQEDLDRGFARLRATV